MSLSLYINIYIYIYTHTSVYENNKLFRKPPLLGPPLSCAKLLLQRPRTSPTSPSPRWSRRRSTSRTGTACSTSTSRPATYLSLSLYIYCYAYDIHMTYIYIHTRPVNKQQGIQIKHRNTLNLEHKTTNDKHIT